MQLSVRGWMTLLVGTITLSAALVVCAHWASVFALHERVQAFRVSGELRQAQNAVQQFKADRKIHDIRQARRLLDDIYPRLKSANPPDQKAALHEAFGHYARALHRLETVLVARGLDENSGAEGELRQRVHEVEDIVAEAKADALMVAMLSARRSEKDFIMRRQPKYIAKVHAAVRTVARLARTLPPGKSQKVTDRIYAYRAGFDRFVGLLDEAEAAFADTARLEGEVASLVEQWVDYESARASAYSAIAIFVLTLSCLSGIGLSIVASRSIGRPLQRMYESASKIASGESTRPIDVEGGRDLRLLTEALNAVALHVEERKSWELQLDSARQNAEAGARAKGRFLAAMSHEIRTPLNAIIGTASVLNTVDLSDDSHRAVERIRSAGEHLLSVVNDILDYSKLEEGMGSVILAPARIGDVVDSVAAIMSPLVAKKSLELVVNVDPRLTMALMIDDKSLRQVLVNLLGNAVKFTDHGRIELNIAALDIQSTMVHVEMSVLDTGAGIAPEDQERLFQPFQQADDSMTRAHEGTGLGLAISRRLVHMMGGTLTVESEVGAGSTFRFELNAAVCEAEPAEAICAPLHGDEKLPEWLRVLIAEDNPANQELVKSMLDRLNVRSTLVADGAQACEKLESEDFDIVLMDMQMPNLSGIDATVRIRQDIAPYRQPWIIAVTANAFEEDRTACLAAGMNDFVPKPMRMEDLERALRRAQPHLFQTSMSMHLSSNDAL